MTDELPISWATAPLDSLCQKFRGVSYGRDDASTVPKKGYVPILRANNLQNDRLVFDELVWVSADHVSDQQKLRMGDIVIAMSSGSKSVVGKTAQIMEDWQGSFGAFCGALRPWPELNSRYVGLFLRTREYRNTISELAAGSNINNLKNEHLAAIEVPVAPLAEQRRIVAKLEKLLGQVDACQQRLEKMPTLLKRFRQSILAAACSGRLTADWREENVGVAPVHSLLAEADKLRNTNVSKANAAAGFKRFRFKPAAQIDLGDMTKGIDELFELPDTWAWASLGQLTWFIADGPHFSPKYVERSGGVPFISGRNVFYHGIDFSDAKYVSKTDHEEFTKRAQPIVGDVLLTKGGTTGIATVVETSEQFSIWVHVALLKTVPELIRPYFLRDALTAPFAYLQTQAQTHGVGNQDLGLTRMIHIALPLPPLAEQQEIVRRVAGLFALADQLEQRLAQARKQVDKLTPSLLARAFAGKLVPQDPSDEPAEKLLEKIKSTHPKKT